MRLVALDEAAEMRGLGLGQSLSDARAICPGLVAREIDRDFTTMVFAEMAHWHANASPIVAIQTDGAPFGDLVLDISGVTHLFNGPAQMLAQLQARLSDYGFTVAGAVAPTIGAAMALSHFSSGVVIEESARLEAMLAGLPIAALRLDESQVAGLAQMGLKRIGQLYGRDRIGLGARFGGEVLERLDQALGHVSERLDPLIPPASYGAMRQFPEPLVLIDDVLGASAELCERLSGQLGADGLGAQGFHLYLFRADHKVMALHVNAARATRDPAHMQRLIANRIEKLREEFDAGFGIEMVQLLASSTGPLDVVQDGVFGVPDGAADIDFLIDRLTSRLGPQAVVASAYANTHIPEKAVILEPAIARREADPDAVPPAEFLRPLRLLPVPEEISVIAEVPDAPPALMEWRHQTYRFARASGPERIAGEWWQADGALPTRDYYIGEDRDGRRFWLFRLGLYGGDVSVPRWFMHGLFA